MLDNQPRKHARGIVTDWFELLSKLVNVGETTKKEQAAKEILKYGGTDLRCSTPRR